ncbi:MAG: alpha/beta hydrolase [Clostridia bacterium]|nr:alpha/beta hydrolase [Clostridia bacterium]
MAIIKERTSFPSTAGQGIDVSYMVWKDDTKPPIGVLQVTHGWGEYGERYDELCTFFARNGYVVAAQDHLGHGRTAGFRRLGLYPKGAATYMIEDMHELYKIMHKQYKDLPYMLYGHSLGSMMVRCYLQKWGDGLDAAVICGTGHFPLMEALFALNPVLTTAASLLSPAYEKEGAKLDKKNAAKTDAFGAREPNAAEGLINSWLSYDKQNIKNYVNDPYIGLAASATILYMAPILTNAGKAGWVRRIPKSLPLYVISGEHDIVGVWNGYGPKLAAKKLEAGGRNVTLKIYKHAKHEIHNEGALKDEVFADLLAFFNAHNKNC